MWVRFDWMKLATATACSLLCGLANAQGLLDPGPAATETRVERPEYAGSIGKATPTEIIQAKAQMKAAQRQGRIATREWYGYSQARPKTTAVPFTGMYGAQFQGYAFGRPAAHYATRPILIRNR